MFGAKLSISSDQFLIHKSGLVLTKLLFAVWIKLLAAVFATWQIFRVKLSLLKQSRPALRLRGNRKNAGEAVAVFLVFFFQRSRINFAPLRRQIASV